jgi:hypothetical protein
LLDRQTKLANVQEAMYSLVAPRELLTVTSGYGASCIFYTNESLIEGFAGFAVYQMEFGNKIFSPAGVFTAELSARFTAVTLLRLYSLRRDFLFSLIT